jgi:carbon-monoxide dehydrogenase iron sulfur subunit
MRKEMIVNYRECTGSRIFEMACSIRNEGVFSTQLSGIGVYLFPPGLDVSVVCVRCVKAPCIEACPLQLLSRETESREVVIQEELCDVWGLCARTHKFVRRENLWRYA